MAERLAERASRAALDRLDFDGERRNFMCIAPVSPDRRPQYRGLLAELERESTSEALALKGKALNYLGDYEAARAALGRSLQLDPGNGRAHVWRAEAALLAGRPADALEDLGAARRLAPEYHWTHFFSAACVLALERYAEVRAHLARAQALAPGNLAVLALRGLAEGRCGEPRQGLSLLDAALEQRRESWLLACRGVVNLEAGDEKAALADMNGALRLEALAWYYAVRSRVRERLGDIRGALNDMKAASRLEPEQALYHAQRAHLNQCRRNYRLAIRDLGTAIGLSPQDPSWLIQRSDTHLSQGDLRSAERDAAAAAGLSGAEPSTALRLARVQNLLGRYADAGRVLEGLQASNRPGIETFIALERGFGAMRRREWGEAVRSFSASRIDAGGEVGALRKLRFYAMLARALEAGMGSGGRESPRKGAQLHICGLGLYPPYTATLETARAVSRMDVAFNNVSGGETAEFLWALAPRVLPTAYDGKKDEDPWADRIFEELALGRKVAFATRGHAQVFGGLAAELIARCRKASIRVRTYAALSSMDVLAAGAVERLEMGDGVQLFDCAALENGARVDAAAALAVYFYAGADAPRLRRLSAILRRKYPAKHPVFLFGPDYGAAPALSDLETLSSESKDLHSSVILWLPSLDNDERA